MTEKFHISHNYHVIKAEKVRSDGSGKPRAIICRIKRDINNGSPLIESLVVWQNGNPRLYKKLAKGIINNQMPILSGTTVILNSTACYYTSKRMDDE